MSEIIECLERPPDALEEATKLRKDIYTLEEVYRDGEVLVKICRALQTYQRRDMFVELFTKLEDCATDSEAKKIISDFRDCGFRFSHIVLANWYNAPITRTSLLDPVTKASGDTASALSSAGGSHGSLLTKAAVAKRVNKTAHIPFNEFNTAVCDGTDDHVVWHKCSTLFEDHTVRNDIVSWLGSEKEYNNREKLFVRFFQLAISFKYVMIPGSNLDELKMVHSLVLAQIRLAARPNHASVERWDNECCLSRTMRTVEGDLVINGFPDLAYISEPTQNRDQILVARQNVASALEEVEAAEGGQKSGTKSEGVQGEGGDEDTATNSPRRKKQKVSTKTERQKQLAAARETLRTWYVPTVLYPIEIKFPALKHAKAGVKKTYSQLNSASKHQLCCQLLCLQDNRGHDVPVFGLLTDGFSGTVLLLCKKDKPNDPHQFIRLPAASSPHEMFRYIMLLSTFSADELQDLMMARIRKEETARTATGGGASSGDQGGQGGAAPSGGPSSGSSGGPSTSASSGGLGGFSGTRGAAAGASKTKRGGFRDAETSSSLVAEADFADDLSDVSSEPGEDDGMTSVHPSVFETDDGFDSDAEFEYYNNPKRALRALRERMLEV